jgi:hypothetical protein
MRTLADIKSTGTKTVTTKRDLTWSKTPETACVIPAGTTLTVHFSELNPSRVYFEYAGSLRASRLVSASQNFTGFGKAPTIATMSRWDMDGIAKTPTGHRVEPDGHGPDGSPSWLLVVGVI